MKKIVLASNNKSKLREMREVLKEFDIEVISQSETGINIDAEETGTTFKENAEIKARAVYNILHIPVISDDSGLCVDYLNGAPGIYTSRYAGENATDDDRMNKLVNALKDAKDDERGCHYTSCVCYIDENGISHFFEEYCKGYVAKEKKGNHGFGYDPIVVVENGKHVAELTDEEKNAISHRGKAVRKFVEYLRNIQK